MNRLNNYKNDNINNENTETIIEKNNLNQNLPLQITNKNLINSLKENEKKDDKNDTATFNLVKKNKQVKNLKNQSSNNNYNELYNNLNEKNDNYNKEDLQYIPFQMMEKEKLYKNIVISQYGKV